MTNTARDPHTVTCRQARTLSNGSSVCSQNCVRGPSLHTQGAPCNVAFSSSLLLPFPGASVLQSSAVCCCVCLRVRQDVERQVTAWERQLQMGSFGFWVPPKALQCGPRTDQLVGRQRCDCRGGVLPQRNGIWENHVLISKYPFLHARGKVSIWYLLKN